MDSSLRLDRDARMSLRRFAADVECIARAARCTLLEDRLVFSYARALDSAGRDADDAQDAWLSFYLGLAIFSRAALRSLVPEAAGFALPALLRCEEILGDDLGAQLFLREPFTREPLTR